MADSVDRPEDLGAPGQRRPATVVAIDAAGYSRQSEIDEGVAVREITALGERLRASAAARGGRVFNTAGDGFMLEFPSAAAAVAAAEEIQSVERVPVRIGLHVGEVSQTASGDLLGKGVNVAARLMQLAQPGNILISEEIKNGLGADVAARLQSIGRVKLDKMQERLEAYALGSPWKRPRPKPWVWAAMGGAAVALVGLFWFGAQAILRPPSQAIAVLEFRALDPSLQAFSAGLLDRFISAMSETDLEAAHTSAAADEDRLAAAARRGAAFVLDGSVRPDGEDLLVNVRLLDTRGDIAVWSGEYRRVTAEQNYMQEQVAADVGHILHCALIGLRDGGARLDTSTLAIFLRACDRHGDIRVNAVQRHQTLIEVTERAPRFSRGWSMRGRSAASFAKWRSRSDEEREAYIREAREAAGRARSLDRSNGEVYLIEADLLQPRDWRGRQAAITRAIERQPDLAEAHAAQSDLYFEVGRLRDALPPLERAAAIEPLNPDYWSSMTPLLFANGRAAEAAELRARLYRMWPNSAGAWFNRFFAACFVDDPAARVDPAVGLQMLDNMAAGPVSFDADVAARWRTWLLARQSGSAARLRTAARGLRTLIPGRFDRDGVAAALSLAGEVDAAIEVMAPAVGNPHYSPATFWMPPWDNVRRDPRFFDLIKEMGLIQYWRETGEWPDVCSERGLPYGGGSALPYDCEAEAARVLPP